MILVGIFLIVAYSQMQQSMVNVDVKSIEARALQGLYTLGVMFLSVGIALVVVASKCPKASIDATRDPVLILSILLSVTMLVLSSILVLNRRYSNLNIHTDFYDSISVLVIPINKLKVD